MYIVNYYFTNKNFSLPVLYISDVTITGILFFVRYPVKVLPPKYRRPKHRRPNPVGPKYRRFIILAAQNIASPKY